MTEPEIRRLDELREAEQRRVDGLFAAQETAVNAALIAAEKAVGAALASADKAVLKAEEAQLRVNATQNEFRGTLADQAATLMPRAEFESVVRELRVLTTQNADQLADMRSRLDIGPPTLGALQARSDNQVGRAEGSGATVRYALLALGGVSTLLGIIGAIALLGR